MLILPRRILNISTMLGQALPAQPCLLCGTFNRRGAWCEACDATLPYLVKPRCPICALPTVDGSTCGRCLQRKPQFDCTVAVFTYAYPLDKLIQALKYGERLSLANSLADSLAQRISVTPDLIIPMPLHPFRLRDRGFNQSLELARRISAELAVAMASDACRRARDTPPQSSLAWKERGSNVRKAFACERDLSGKHVAVVDDVMTSGSTLNEVAIALRKAGASAVSAWVVARTIPYSKRQ